jgi:hypothetical protein
MKSRVFTGLFLALALALVPAAELTRAGHRIPNRGSRIPTDDPTITHVLNRLTFGPRPG